MKKTLAICALLASMSALGWAQQQPQYFTLTAAGSSGAASCATVSLSDSDSTVGIIVGPATWSGTLTPTVKIFNRASPSDPSESVVVWPTGQTTPASQATITANGGYYAIVGGFKQFSLCATSLASGSVNVQLSPASGLQAGSHSGTGGSGTVNTGTQGLPTVYPSSTASVVATGLFIDAAQFTSGISGDSCAAISNAIASTAFTNGTLTINTKAFQGNQACNSDPYGSYNGVMRLEIADNVNWISSVPWLTPQKSNWIIGGIAGNSAATNGARIVASGPLVSAIPGVSYNSNTASFNATIPGVGSTAVTVAQMTLGAAPLTFTIPHGPFPAGSYFCMICEGGQNFNLDGDAQHIQGVAISTGGNSNIFGIYSPTSQERSEMLDMRLGCCGLGTNAAGYFGDRTEYATGTVTGGGAAQAGVTRPVGRDINLAGEQTAACTSCYMFVFEGEAITVVFTGGTCSVAPTAYVGSASVAAGVISSVSVGNPGLCTVGPTGATIYGAPTTFGGSTNQTAAVSSVTLTGSSPNIKVTAVNLSSGGSGYVNSAITGGPMLSDIACAGLAGGNTIWDCLLLDGAAASWAQNFHNINGGNFVIEAGIYGPDAGGVISNVDSNTAGGVHLGYMIDGAQALSSIGAASGKSIIQDDVYLNGAPLTSANFGRGVAFYLPGSIVDALYGFYIPCETPAQTGYTGLVGIYCTGSSLTFSINANTAFTMTPQGTVTKGANFALQGTAPEFTTPTANSFAVMNTLLSMPNNTCNFSFTTSTLTLALSPVSACTGSNGGATWGSLPATATVWNWSCQFLYSVQAGTTPTFQVGVTWAHAPSAAAQVGSLVTSATNTGTNAGTATTTNVFFVSSGTLTPATTPFIGMASGSFTASATAGTFSPTFILTGTGATGTAVGSCSIL